MNEVMAAWSNTSLGDLADIAIGGTPSRDIESYWALDRADGFPWVAISDLGDRVITNTKEQITEAGIHNSNVKLVSAGTVLMSFKLSLGRVAFTGLDLYTNEAIAAFKSRGEITEEYLFYVLPEAVRTAATDVAIKGATLNKESLKALRIPYPVISVQRKIATILTAMDAAIEKTEALIAKYQQIKAGLMHDLFTRGVLPNGKLRPPREQAPELYQETAVGWIPREWDFLTLGEIASFQRGHDIVEAQFKDGDFPVISSSGVIGFHSKSTTKSPNVVIGRKGTIGKVHFMEQDFWAHDTSLFTTNFFGNYEKFVFHLCIYLELAKFGTKSGSPSLNRNDIHPIRVGRPQRGEQMAITKLLDTTELHIDLNRIKLSKLKKQKLGLMQDLLTGKVPVRVDEPTLDAVDG